MAPLGTCALAMPLGGGNPNGRVAKAWRWCRGVRRRTGWAGLASTVLAMAAGLVTLWYLWTLVFVLAPGGFGGRPSSGSSASRPDGQGAKEGPYMRALKLERLADIEGGFRQYNRRVHRSEPGKFGDDLFAFEYQQMLPFGPREDASTFNKICVKRHMCALIPTQFYSSDQNNIQLSVRSGFSDHADSANASIVTIGTRLYVHTCPLYNWIFVRMSTDVKKFALVIQPEVGPNDYHIIYYTNSSSNRLDLYNPGLMCRLTVKNNVHYCTRPKKQLYLTGGDDFRAMNCVPPLPLAEISFNYEPNVGIITGMLSKYNLEIIYIPEKYPRTNLENAIVKMRVKFVEVAENLF